jgi:MFS family permease
MNLILTFIGFLIIWAQFSDVLGRKAFVVLALVVFIAFSGACGGAQTATQLYVLLLQKLPQLLSRI